MKNIEIKFRLKNYQHYLDTIEKTIKLGAAFIWERDQRDTFFPVPEGWLKLREEKGESPVLISYKRSTSTEESRQSEYFLVPIVDSKKTIDGLKHVLNPIKTLYKTRIFYKYKHTKIHVDDVKDLGYCMEFETIVDGISEQEAKTECDFIVSKLVDKDVKPVTVPYVELL